MRPSTIRRLAAVGFAAAAVTAAAVTAAASPAAATGDHTNICTTVGHGVTTDIAIVPAATVELLEDGVRIKTPDIPAKANWKSGPADVKLTDLTVAEYSTKKEDTAAPAALPAFHLYLKTTGGKLATIVYEPYYQISGNPEVGPWKTWNVLTGKWWTSSSDLTGVTPEGGGSYAGNKTLAYIAEKNPGVKVVAYGWGQGTYNAGAVAQLNNLKFDAKNISCVLHKWSTKYKPSPSPSVSKTVSPSPSASASASKSVSSPVSPSTSPTSSLPVTGVSTPGLVGVGVALLASGGGVLLLLRRRRDQVKFTT